MVYNTKILELVDFSLFLAILCRLPEVYCNYASVNIKTAGKEMIFIYITMGHISKKCITSCSYNIMCLQRMRAYVSMMLHNNTSRPTVPNPNCVLYLISKYVVHFSGRPHITCIFIIMRPSSLGGGRIFRRTLPVCLSVCPSVCLSVRPSRYRM